MANFIYILLAGSLWGIISIFVHVLQLYGFTSMQCVAIRASFTTIILGIAFLLFNRNAFVVRIRDFLYFLGTGLASIVFFNFCYFTAIQLVGGASIPALLLYTAPAIVMILSVLLFHEEFTRQKGIALVLTMIGLILVTCTSSDIEGSTISVKAILYGLGAGLGYAMYSIFSKYLVQRYSAMTITFYTFLMATFATVPISGLMEQVSLLFTVSIFPYAIGLAVICTVMPFAFYTKGLSGIEASQASILATIEPVVAGIVGVVYFGESLSILECLGIALVISSIVILNKNVTNK